MDAAGHHPDLGYAALGNSGGSSSSGAFWGCKQPGGLEEPWDGSLFSGGGSGLDGDPNEAPVYPAAYRLELSINGETETLTLTPPGRRRGMNPEQDVLYCGVSRIAWSYLFAFFNLNLGSLNILPDWMAFALIYGALDLLAEEERELPLLKPFCILLGLWEGAGWLAQLFGLTLSLYPLDLLFAALSLYFYFQLLTNLSLDIFRSKDVQRFMIVGHLQ